MRASDAGLKFIAEREGVRLAAYPDPGTGGAPWTIGVGHTRGVKQGDTCCCDQAMAWLVVDATEAEDAVNRLVKVPLTQHQFDALVDFVFNEGAGNFAGSTLLRLLNAGDYDGADRQFCRWNIAAGHVMGGLTRRRALEAAKFGEAAQ
jgi:lysozyme